MADRNAPASFTFEEWRVEFNELATDVGDIGGLPATINGSAVTDIVEAVSQLNSAISSTGITLSGDGGSDETLVISDTLEIAGGNNVTTTVSATDTLTVELDSAITGMDSIRYDGTSFNTTLLATDPSVNRTVYLPDTDGTLTTEGSSIALAVALG
jgi:hypothetical protein